MTAESRRTYARAFTIIELLVVIVIIAILATLSIIAFNGIQNRGRASAASSALSQAGKKLALWHIENSVDESISADCSTFAAVIGSTMDPDNDCSSKKDNVSYQYRQGVSGTNHYCITATVESISYRLNTTTSNSPEQGGCAGHGQGGISAIVNLATNPRATTYSSQPQIGLASGRWFGGSGTPTGSYSTISNATDGPVGIKTYARKSWSGGGAPSISATSDTGFGTSFRTDVNQGDTYSFSCYLRPSVARNFHIGVYQYTSSGTAASPAREYGAGVFGPANQWTRVTHTYTVPTADIASINVVCDSSNSAVNGAQNWTSGATLDGTGLMITAGSTLHEYADGESNNWIWNGTPHNSSSTGPPL
jgi:prepilin-type N-terminal cleavage/methylation domain-containing protein